MNDDYITAVRRGDMLPQLQRQSLRFQPEGGFVRELAYRGFDLNQMLSLYYQFAAAGVECEYTEEQGIFSLTTIDTRGEERIDRWEVQVDEEQPSVLQNPYLNVNVVANGGAVSAAHQFLIAVALKKGLDLAAAVTDLDVLAQYPAIAAPAAGTRAYRIFEQMTNGQTQYQDDRLVVLHTTNVSNRYQQNIADTNKNRLYTHAQFLTEVLSAALWIFPMPGALEYAATYFFNEYEPTAKDYYLWSWLKSASPRVTVANNRVDIATKYKLDQWSTDRYALAT